MLIALAMPLRYARSKLVAARDWMDGRLHPGRHTRARETLSALQPQSLVVLCLGNVCRSPYAGRLLAERLPQFDVASAGFIGPGRQPPETALAVAAARGLDHADHRSQVLTPDLLGSAEGIFVFDRFNIARVRQFGGAEMRRVFWLGDFDPMWTGKRAIIDPWGKPPEEFERTFERIERCVNVVVETLRE